MTGHTTESNFRIETTIDCFVPVEIMEPGWRGASLAVIECP